MEKIGFKPMRRVYLNRFTVYCLRSLSHFSSYISWRKTSVEKPKVFQRKKEEISRLTVPLFLLPGLKSSSE
jgi:hypothetical protein